MRLIDADVAKENVEKLIAGKSDFAIDMRNACYTAIDYAPTIEPKRGKWVQSDKSGINYKRVTVCNICDKRSNYKHNFCPNCGADMRTPK